MTAQRIHQCLEELRNKATSIACSLARAISDASTSEEVHTIIDQTQEALDTLVTSEILEQNIDDAEQAAAREALYSFERCGENREFRIADWQHEVISGHTLYGYESWVRTSLTT